MTINNKTIEFHLLNISKNNRYLAHRAAIENEISDLRFTAYNLANTEAGEIATRKADELYKKLEAAMEERQNI